MKVFYNRVTLIGELTDVPKLTSFDGGRTSASLRLRLDRGYVTKDGEMKTSQVYVKCFAGGKWATGIATDTSLKAGTQITVEGPLRSYKNKDGAWELVVDVLYYQSHGDTEPNPVSTDDLAF